MRKPLFLGLALAAGLAAQWVPLNPVTGVQKEANGVLLTMHTGAMRVEVCNDAIIHVVYSPVAAFPNRPDYVVTKSQWPASEWKLEASDQAIAVTTPRLKVTITRHDSLIAYTDSAGRKLVQEGPKTMTPAKVNGEQTYSAEDNISIYGSEEAFYGLGQHQAGVWNYRGESVDVSQDNTSIAVPLLVSSNGYGIFWNNTSRTRFNNRFVHSLYISSEVADVIDYYFIYGPEFDKIVAGYRELTGAAPMFGKWAYGFWQCKNKYQSQQELLDVAHKYRQLHIPVDNIVQDWFWWTTKGEFVWNQHYPDAKGMIDDLHQNHFHLMISVWPYFDPGTPTYADMDRQGYFIDRTKVRAYHPAGMAVYDATNPAARAYYWNLMDKALFQIGADAWWLDTTEPETEGREENLMLNNKLFIGSGARYANIFPLMATATVYEGQRQASDRKRVYILSRSAFAGAQRNAVTAWSGDILSDFESYKRQIPAGLNFALSGIPYWTTDIGGFFIGNPNDAAYRELFVRWFQYGTFCPVFRVHGTRTTNQNELWSYGPEAESILTKFDRLRYELLPYIYSVAWMTTSQSYTPMRPLVMDFRGDVRAQNIGDQFLFGPAILVNPVTEPGATTRHLYLPKTEWYDFWTGHSTMGGRAVDAEAPLDSLPLLVRAGSIIPMGPDLEYAAEKPADPIELRVYQGADADFTLYEDEGDNYDYEKGAYATIPMHWDDSARSLTIGDRKGQFPGMLASRTFRVVFVGEGHGTGIGQTAQPDKVVEYSGAAVTVAER
ncbi:MAG TPA: glycoside hydrolase family 31 protein [Bryobacteraceae bacterium]|nr:glycoside hydrolase family 31 protein [Bryobacteraceae bacterium]